MLHVADTMNTHGVHPTHSGVHSRFSGSNDRATKGNRVPDGTTTNSTSRTTTISQVDPGGFSSGKGGGALRPVDQTFEVNPSNGTLALNLPLHVTNNRNDLHPMLKLSYNSGSGNGPFGLGWNIPLDSITIKTTSNIPRYNGSDTFVFAGLEDLVEDGEKFLYSGSLGTYLVQRYRLRVEDGERARIERFTNEKDEEDVFWRSISPANVTSFFGRTDQSRVMETPESGPNRIFSWLLCEVYDSVGNAMLFTYKSENEDGIRGYHGTLPCFEESKDPSVRRRARYLKSIKYGNVTPARDMKAWHIVTATHKDNWTFEVVFDYGEHDLEIPTTTEKKHWGLRRDVSSTYSSGFEIRSYRICRRILLFHHFPKKLPLQDYLVQSYNLHYDEGPGGSFLNSFVASGHLWDENKGSYMSQNLQAYSYSYTSMPSLESLQLKAMKPRCLQTLPINQRDTQTRWVDLNSEGAPGLLVQVDGAWYFQRNENIVNTNTDTSSESDSASSEELETRTTQCLGPVQVVNSCPVLGDYRDSYFEDLDGTGLKDLVFHDEDGRANGYYECHSKDEWSNFKTFPTSLNFNTKDDKSIHRLDLTGNGRRDVLRSMGSGFSWYASLGKDGFDLERTCTGEDGMRMIMANDQRSSLYFADVSGDGLADVLRVSNGRVAYCPNLGYGVFGTEIVMQNCPIFDSDDQFSFQRLHLVDLDGSGTTDIIYLTTTGEAVAYFNFCGNSWSKGVTIQGFPRLDNLSSVFCLDLLGNGTSCLCWVGPDGAVTDDLMISYIDLCGGSKPHLLKNWSNGLGLSIETNYTPSTRFYHQDERNGRPWKTKLPFPVHVLSCLTEKDDITKSTKVTKFRYHDGYFDSQEREFRGFAMVEKWESEETPVPGRKRYLKLPTCYTRMWYHTGAEELGLAPLSSETFNETRTQSAIPKDLDKSHVYDAYRALKGRLLRTEVYGIDQSSASDKPYTVFESSYDVMEVKKAKNAEKPPIVLVRTRESVTAHHERQTADVRVDHELVLETNLYGDITKILHLRYGKETSVLSKTETRAAQEKHHITYTESLYTNAIADEPDDYYKPLPASKRVFYIECPPTAQTFDVEKFRSKGIQAMEGTVSTGPQTKTYYRSRDLTHRLEFGTLESFSVLDREFQLAMTNNMCTSILGSSDVTFRNVSLSSTLFGDCGYVDLDQDKSAWISTPEVLWDGDGVTDAAGVLERARSTFFIPKRYRDASGSISTVKMDEFHQLAVETIDPAENIITAEIDYRVMQATLITNSNQNRVRVVHDALGEVVAFAQMGKATESAGDSVDDVTLIITDAEMLSFINTPSHATALRLLGESGGRTLVCRKRLTSPSSENALPTFRLALVRTEHHQNDPGDIQVKITYLNGRGAEVQTLKLTDWDGGETKWCVATDSIRDAQGNVVMGYQPYFSSSAFFQPFGEQKRPFQLRFLDALRRGIGTLSPDHTWTKIHLHPWMTTEYKSSDNLQVADPRSDPDVGFYFSLLDPDLFVPSWLELRSISNEARIRDSAAEVAKHASNPWTMHFDTCGNVIETLEPGEGRTHTTRSDFDVFGNLVARFDVLGREVERSQFDMLGRPFVHHSMDSGTRLALLDYTGQVVMECNSAKIQCRMVYDSLSRRTQTWILEPDSKTEILWSKIKYGEQEPEAASRNLRGHVFEVADQSGIRRNTLYDFKGNCLSTSLYLALEYRTTLDWRQQIAVEEEPHTSSFEFDAINRAKTDTDAAGNVVIRTFDTIGHLKTLYSSKVKDRASTAPHITKAMYAADGQPLRIDYGNSSCSVYTYDENTRLLTHQRTWRGDGTVLEDLSWVYDCTGRVSSVEDAAHQTQFFRNEMVAPRRNYWYDDFGRLIRASGREKIETGGNTSRSLRQVLSSSPLLRESLPFGQASEVCGYVEMYSYDDADNILSVQHQSSDASIAGWTRTYEYKEPSRLEPSVTNNRLSRTRIGGFTEEYGYDGDAGQVGCMTSMPGFSRLGWDCNNKMRCSARQKVNDGEPETTWYVYDDSGRRVRKVVDRETTGTLDASQPRRLKETLFLDALEIHHTYGGDGRTKKTTTNTSLISGILSNRTQTSVSIEELVLTTEKSRLSPTTLSRYHMSASLETDDRGQVVSYEEYNPFGVSMLLACRSDVEAPRRYRFAAYQRDNETGLYACGARYYAPWLGRWTSPDPLGTADGDNMYAYVQNDPVNWIDPGGTFRIFGKSAKVQQAPSAKRRGGTLDFAKDLKKTNVSGYFQLEKLQEKAKHDEKPFLERKIEEAGGGKMIAIKAGKAVASKAASFVPIVGPLLSMFINQSVGMFEQQLKEAGMNQKDIEHRVAAYKLGMKDLMENLQGEFISILTTDGLSSDERENKMAALVGLHRERLAADVVGGEEDGSEDEGDLAFCQEDEDEDDQDQDEDIDVIGLEDLDALSESAEDNVERKSSDREIL